MVPLPKTSDPRFPLSAILQSLTAAGGSEIQGRFLKELRKGAAKRGRKEEDDADAVRRVVDVIAEDEAHRKLGDRRPGLTVNAAAVRVAADYPETQRNAVRKRLARKTKILLEENEDILVEAKKRAADKYIDELERKIEEGREWLRLNSLKKL